MLPVSFSPLAELGLKELVRSGVESFYFRKIIWQVQGGEQHSIMQLQVKGVQRPPGFPRPQLNLKLC